MLMRQALICSVILILTCLFVYVFTVRHIRVKFDCSIDLISDTDIKLMMEDMVDEALRGSSATNNTHLL